MCKKSFHDVVRNFFIEFMNILVEYYVQPQVEGGEWCGYQPSPAQLEFLPLTTIQVIDKNKNLLTTFFDDSCCFENHSWVFIPLTV